MIRIYKSKLGNYYEIEGKYYQSQAGNWDIWINTPDLYQALLQESNSAESIDETSIKDFKINLLAPIESQEVWASGVTYLRSRDARMEESENAKTAYDRVYEADRPELFFKSTASRVAGPGDDVNIRKDSTWNVPEPELTLFINNRAEIAGYTVGNDMSSRSIEGENTLYLPQAKTYERSAALGPCILLTASPIHPDTTIDLKIYRENSCVYHGQTQLNTMKRKLQDLVDYLHRGLKFEQGCFLMTGTGIVPPSTFTLESEDEVHIEIESIGTLKNVVKWF
ncbi:MAG: fumarylacetoacetate hydrolase family protein [Saprospiraceae bacterium]